MMGVDMDGLQVEIDRSGREARKPRRLSRDEVRFERAVIARYCRLIRRMTYEQAAQVMHLPVMTVHDLRNVDLKGEEAG
jgi:hypothetical protein